MTKEDFERTSELLRHRGFTVGESSYDPKAFGSWYVCVVRQPRLRIVWDGKDGWAIVQQETSERFQGMTVWEDLWVGQERQTQTPEFVVSKFQVLSGGR